MLGKVPRDPVLGKDLEIQLGAGKSTQRSSAVKRSGDPVLGKA